MIKIKMEKVFYVENVVNSVKGKGQALLISEIPIDVAIEKQWIANKIEGETKKIKRAFSGIPEWRTIKWRQYWNMLRHSTNYLFDIYHSLTPEDAPKVVIANSHIEYKRGDIL